jgi:hypothetical protein
LTQITIETSPSHPERGAYRDRHERWVWDAMAATASGAKALDETLVADGEVVWSWRPDAGVKLQRSKLLGGDGGNKARSPGSAK